MWYLVKQPDNLYSVWSTVVDNFLYANLLREDILDVFCGGKQDKYCVEKMELRLTNLETTPEVYDFNQCCAMIKNSHQKIDETMLHLIAEEEQS